jgi:acyl-CoA reductase-like NAD-dependent aldehyde dehydrogenase
MDIGPLIDAATRDAVDQTIARACNEADRVLLRGKRSGHAFLSPTLVEHSDPKGFFCQEEIFGPFVTLETFDTEAQAIEKANDTVFGLSASVWTHDGARLSDRACVAQRHGVDQRSQQARCRSGNGRIPAKRSRPPARRGATPPAD